MDFIVNLVLIPRYACVGATIGTLIAEFVVLLYQYIILHDLVTEMFKAISYWKIIAGTAVGSIFSLAVLKFSLNNFLTLLISAIVFFGIYCLMLMVFKEELSVEITKGLLNKIRRRKS